MDYKEMAEQKGLKFEVETLENIDFLRVEGATEQVLAFQKESEERGAFSLFFHELDDGTSNYTFVE